MEEKSSLVELVTEGVLPKTDGRVFLRGSGPRKFSCLLASCGCRFPYLVGEAKPVAETCFRIYRQAERVTLKDVFSELALSSRLRWEECQVGAFLAENSETLFALSSCSSVAFFLYPAEDKVNLCMAFLNRRSQQLRFDIYEFSPRESPRVLCPQNPENYFFVVPTED